MKKKILAADDPQEAVADLLRKQLHACHNLVEDCFARAVEDGQYYKERDNAMKIGARLIQSCAGLAIALKRLEGNQQNIVVTHAPANGSAAASAV